MSKEVDVKKLNELTSDSYLSSLKKLRTKYNSDDNYIGSLLSKVLNNLFWKLLGR